MIHIGTMYLVHNIIPIIEYVKYYSSITSFIAKNQYYVLFCYPNIIWQENYF